MRLSISFACGILVFVSNVLGAPRAGASEPPTATSQRQGNIQASPAQASPTEERCTRDGLIHAEVSAEITAQVKKRIRFADQVIGIHDIAKLILPCGFRLDSRFGWNLVLTDGKELRQYRENNAFGFMPPFGFAEQNESSYQLKYQLIDDSSLRTDPCWEILRAYSSRPRLCSSFGSASSFFGATPNGIKTMLAHYVVQRSRLEEDFRVAEIDEAVDSIFFIHSVDTPGGSITLMLNYQGMIYRAFVDVAKG